jgi:hypothetical protein
VADVYSKRKLAGWRKRGWETVKERKRQKEGNKSMVIKNNKPSQYEVAYFWGKTHAWTPTLYSILFI